LTNFKNSNEIYQKRKVFR